MEVNQQSYNVRPFSISPPWRHHAVSRPLAITVGKIQPFNLFGLLLSSEVCSLISNCPPRGQWNGETETQTGQETSDADDSVRLLSGSHGVRVRWGIAAP